MNLLIPLLLPLIPTIMDLEDQHKLLLGTEVVMGEKLILYCIMEQI